MTDREEAAMDREIAIYEKRLDEATAERRELRTRILELEAELVKLKGGADVQR